jgi:uncharacterized protein
MSEFRHRIQSYIQQQARPIEKYGHQPRLYAVTLEVGQGHRYDDDIVFAAAWLHDLGVFIGHRPEDPKALKGWDNTAYAMAQAPQLLDDFGFPAAKREAVIEAIRTHQPSKLPLTMEGEILRDSDILEQLGSIGILRTVCKVGRDSRFPDFTSAVEALRNALASLPGQIHLGSTRALAEPRIELLESFLSHLSIEAGPNLF